MSSTSGSDCGSVDGSGGKDEGRNNASAALAAAQAQLAQAQTDAENATREGQEALAAVEAKHFIALGVSQAELQSTKQEVAALQGAVASARREGERAQTVAAADRDAPARDLV